MKERILSNWSLMRVFYIIIGGTLIIQSVLSRQWIGVVVGGYFAAMGVFAFGCASGNCYGGQCEINDNQKNPFSRWKLKKQN